MRERSLLVLGVIALVSWGATVPYQSVVSLCPPRVCIGSANAQPVEIWVDGKPYISISTAGVMTTMNGGSISTSGTSLTDLDATNITSGTLGFAYGGSRMSETAKAKNEIVNNSSTLQSDDELTFAIASGNAFEIEYIVLWDGAANADIKFNLSVPANVTYSIGAGCLATTAAAIEGDFRNSSTSSSGADIVCGAAGAASFLQTTLKARVQSSTGAGNVVIQWAQNAAQNSDTTIYSGSYLRRFRVQ